jgi:hypothetical protein
VNSRSARLQSSYLYSIEVRGIVNCVRRTVNLAFPVATNFVARELNSHWPHTWLLTSCSLSRNVQLHRGRVQLLHVEFHNLI